MGRLQINPKVAVGVVFVSAFFLNILDVTIVNVALPTIGHDFHAGSSSVDAVVTSYLVSLAVFIPASGWIGDRFGSKRVLLTAIAIFTIASALAGQAQNLNELVACRLLQGVGGGMLTPVGMALLMRTYPPHERMRASRVLMLPTAFAPALGPVIGGLLVTKLSWRWVFYVNLPVGLFAFVFGLFFLSAPRQGDAGRFDIVGFLLAGTGFPALVYAVSEGPGEGWSNPHIAETGIIGAVLVIVLVFVELRRKDPMLDFRILVDRLFRKTLSVMFLTMICFLGTLYLVSLFYQFGLGASPLISGLSTFPEAIGVMIASQIATRMYPKFGPRPLIFGGMAGIAVVTSLMSLAGAQTSLWYMRILMFFLGVSIAHVIATSQTTAFATISHAAMGRASGLYNVARQLGSAAGVAFLTTVLAASGTVYRTLGVHHENLNGFHVAFRAAAGLAVLAALLALRIHNAEAASTMSSPKVAERHSPVIEEIPTAVTASVDLQPRGLAPGSAT